VKIEAPARTARPQPRARYAAQAICLLLAVVSPAGADDYVVVPGKPNLVRFESQAPLESFDGKTSQVKGTSPASRNRVITPPSRLYSFGEFLIVPADTSR